jgi:hypothetical protein
MRVGHGKFPAAVEADAVSAMLDREHATHVTVPATEKELDKRAQESYHSRARCRRSQLPFVSSHSSRERTLPRASAIEQSAAP